MPDIESQKSKEFIEADAGDGTTREDHYLTGLQLVFCMIGVLMCLFLFGLDQAIIAPALTPIGNEFGSLDQIGWISSGYFLPVVVFTVTWGKLSIIFGRKSTLIAAVVLFEAGSLMCALSNDMKTLIGGRVLAGVGGGGIQSLSFVIVNEVVPISKRSLMFACFGVTFALSTACGPLIGGVFASRVSWRWCFYVNLPIGGVALAFFYFTFKPPKIQGSVIQKLKLVDYFGTFLLASGLVLFLLGLTFGAESQFPWKSAAVIICIILGALLIVSFGVWNFKFSKNPIIDPAVVKSPQVLAAVIGMTFMMGFFMAYLLYLSVYLQNVIGKTPIGVGVSLLPAIIPTTLCSIATGVMINKTKLVKPFVVVGGILAPIGCGLLTLLDVNSNSGQRVGFLIIGSASIGFMMQGFNMAGQLAAPPVVGGQIMTGTFLVFARGLGASVASILSELAYNVSLEKNLKEAVANLKNQDILNELSHYDLSTLVSSTTILSSLSPASRYFVRKQMVSAVRNVFYLCVGLAGGAFLSTLFTTNKKVPEFKESKETKDVKDTESGDSKENVKEIESGSSDTEQRDTERDTERDFEQKDEPEHSITEPEHSIAEPKH